jgi:nicotinate-nucleotide adenylyltransferase
LGGSFNPPHAAHRAISVLALKRLGLDCVWWVVSPGNPLKDNHSLPPLAERMAAARTVARHPRILVTDLEARLGTRYTIDTLRHLLKRCPDKQFVWLMGADILSEMNRWRDWRTIFHTVPIAVVDRGRVGPAALAAPAALAFRGARLPESRARQLAGSKPPAWVFQHRLKSPLSSTAQRQGAITHPDDATTISITSPD